MTAQTGATGLGSDKRSPWKRCHWPWSYKILLKAFCINCSSSLPCPFCLQTHKLQDMLAQSPSSPLLETMALRKAKTAGFASTMHLACARAVAKTAPGGRNLSGAVTRGGGSGWSRFRWCKRPHAQMVRAGRGRGSRGEVPVHNAHSKG